VPETHVVQDARLGVVDHFDRNNPCLPQIKSPGNGVGGAVVYLRRVDAAKSKPWDLPSARIALKNGVICVEQGAGDFATGFVRLGDSVEMISRSSNFDQLRANGAAFFTIPFPDADKPLQRAFKRSGVVEFSSGVNHFFARSWLFVTEHPYYARTDYDGNFVLPNVPEGNYEIVCWLPNWHVERFERDPELLYVSRIFYAPPVEKIATVQVATGKKCEDRFCAGNCRFSESS